jgi:hypothetical protein
LVDIMAGEEAADFMGVEEDSVEVEVGEVTAKPHLLFPIHYADQ